MTQLPPDELTAAAAAQGSTAAGQTGHPRVDDLVAGLDASADLPPADRIAPLSRADRVLRETLDSIGDV